MKAMIRYQYQIFWLALTFFSRIPMPTSLPYSEQRMNHAGRYFALVGLLIGLLLTVCLMTISLVLPLSISLLITIIMGTLLTGAFHEDGLADTVDGLGGGYTVEQRLTIMKDSRLGTYGALALILSVLLRYELLLALIPQVKPWVVFLLGHGASRSIAGSLIFNTPYVSDLDQSKSKPLAKNQRLFELLILLFTGALPLFFLQPIPVLCILVTLMTFRWFFRRWLLRSLGGFVGDCLGAAQQISEILIYITLLVLLSQGMLIVR